MDSNAGNFICSQFNIYHSRMAVHDNLGRSFNLILGIKQQNRLNSTFMINIASFTTKGSTEKMYIYSLYNSTRLIKPTPNLP